MGGAVVPTAAKSDPYVGVGLDVLHILRVLAELGYEPELVADLAASQWRAARLSRLAAGCLEQRLKRHRPHQTVRDVLLKQRCDAVTKVVGHGGPFLTPLRFAGFPSQVSARPPVPGWCRSRTPHGLRVHRRRA